MEEKNPKKGQSPKAKCSLEPTNKYKPQQKIRPTIAASRVGQPTAQRVTGARINSVKVNKN